MREACRKVRLWGGRGDLSGGFFCAVFLSEHLSGGIGCPSRGSKFSLGVPTWALLYGAERRGQTPSHSVWSSDLMCKISCLPGWGMSVTESSVTRMWEAAEEEQGEVPEPLPLSHVLRCFCSWVLQGALTFP